MSDIQVVFWSQTGNTAAMAQAVVEGIEAAGKSADLKYVDQVSVMELKDTKVVALGCPAMGAEVLEEAEMEPFVEEFCAIASGKSVGLFGSYGWGDGEWMRNWVNRMQEAGATVVDGEGVICQEMPDEAALSECRTLGSSLASLL